MITYRGREETQTSTDHRTFAVYRGADLGVRSGSFHTVDEQLAVRPQAGTQALDILLVHRSRCLHAYTALG